MTKKRQIWDPNENAWVDFDYAQRREIMMSMIGRKAYYNPAEMERTVEGYDEPGNILHGVFDLSFMKMPNL